eukprot:TRINITY_DN5656_c0_g1_i1.p1 TRINITY_DN5656_c0_g1~~TRINITY_DN5656_c0_g1_i1.p1  ORF type:complete len:427 (-),score=82.71 TRINITY_DN5656_c0_g1_i1:347-1627(-)
MSHRKFERPRHGSLGFLPKKRARRHQGRIRSFPRDDKSKKPHLTAFLGYKAGMTHIIRDLDKPGSKQHRKEVLEAVTILAVPPMIVVGIVGYVETPRGLRALTSVWSSHLSNDVRRRFYKKWYHSRKKAFTQYAKKVAQDKGASIEKSLRRMAKYSSVIRIIAHTQPSKLPFGQKKANVLEIQVNGGTVPQKIQFAKSLLEKAIPADTIFAQDEQIDICSVTKGKGFQGVVKRWGVTKLPRKTHKGLRKVACIGAWHPSRVSYAVARAGQKGYHHRTEQHKKIYRLGKSNLTAAGKNSGSTEFDITDKDINPMGGFVGFGLLKEDFIMVKGSIGGPRKRPITLRKTIIPQTTRNALEKVSLKFIDTSSKKGHGRFQTSEEKRKFMGPVKKELIKAAKKAAKEAAKAGSSASSEKKKEPKKPKASAK